MTTTMTSHRLTREQIDELRNAIIDSHVESIFLHSGTETQNAQLLSAYAEKLSADYDIRELTEEDFNKLSMEVDTSILFRWWLNRLNAVSRATSIEPTLIDQWLSNAMSFNLLTASLNEYDNEGTINSQSGWMAVFTKYPLSRIMVLWQVLSINIYIANSAKDSDDDSAK